MGVAALWPLLRAEEMVEYYLGSSADDLATIVSSVFDTAVAVDLSTWIVQADSQQALSALFSREERCMKVAFERVSRGRTMRTQRAGAGRRRVESRALITPPLRLSPPRPRSSPTVAADAAPRLPARHRGRGAASGGEARRAEEPIREPQRLRGCGRPAARRCIPAAADWGAVPALS